MQATRKFWPFALDSEVEIYENPSWDLPGLKRHGKRPPVSRKRTEKKTSR